MIVHYDIPQINKILGDFYHATGARIDFFNTDFVPISSGRNGICHYCQAIQQQADCQKRCRAFDTRLLQKSRDSRQTECAVCPFGLTNLVFPIFWNNTIIGYLFFGQMKTTRTFPDTEGNQELYEMLPLFDTAKIQAVANLAEILIGHILTENMVKPDSSEILQRAVSFIQENLDSDLSVKRIAKQVNVSKSALYSKFHACFHCTMGEYINQKRIEKSVDLLRKTNLSIEEISLACGFSTASYFSKTFRQQRGITPLKFRKSQL